MDLLHPQRRKTGGYTFGPAFYRSSAKEPTLSRAHVLVSALVLAVLAVATPAARAEEPYNFTVTLLGGVGGSLDVDPDPGLANPSFALGLSMVTEPRTHVGLRLGQFEVDETESFGGIRDASLRYGLVTGEYRQYRNFYDSGLFAGIGGYQVEGSVVGADYDDSAFGGAVGVTGEFRLTRWLGFQVEVSAHYADFEVAQFFVLGHAGFAIHF
jgi:hypothetical protein